MTVFRFFIIAFCIFLTRYSSDTTSKDVSGQSKSDTDSTNTFRASSLSADKELISQYEKELTSGTESFKAKFISRLIAVMQQFNGNVLDTTMIVVGNLDGDNKQDTIRNRVYLVSKDVTVKSSWVVNNDTLWKSEFQNPYFVIDTNHLFEPDTTARGLWLTFSTAINYSIPTIESKAEFDNSFGKSKQMLFDFGISELKQKGINISLKEYQEYLNNFKGELLNFGEPENREGLYIWYQPAKCFITYYHA